MADTNTQEIQKGLSSREADRRLLDYGENVIYHKKKLRPIIAFLKKFNSPLLLMLIGTSVVSLFLGQSTSAVIILIMVLLSATMDFVNTRKSENVADALVAQVASTAQVWRDGELATIPLKFLVPGDMIDLEAGKVIPADCRILSADDFFVNQSALTGESFPVEKYADKEKGTALLSKGEAFPLSSETGAFMGTSVVTGFATAVILRTGAAAELGRIASGLAAPEPETDFDRGIRNFSVFVMRLTLVMVTVVFAINTAMHKDMLDSFLFSVAIAVGLTPELLPVIMSVSLARGSLKMAQKQVIVKNLSSIQSFGGINILCTDKTGTLTKDKISLVRCVDITGKDSDEVMRQTYLTSVMHTAKKGPLDAAIEEHGKMDVAEFTKVDEIPFDFHRRRDSVVVDHNGVRQIISKGAPENIFAACSRLQNGVFTEEKKKEALDAYSKLSSEGYRVLGIAEKIVKTEDRMEYHKEEEIDMTFLGLAAFLDPPKKSVAPALLELEGLHIGVKILTGDSEVLTERICKDIGLPICGVLNGDQIASLSDSELTSKLSGVNVFARVSPEQKERIVVLLRKQGNVVGYLGDGINDAPVLKAADVGISVNNAVDVAKETADIILLDKSLEVLKDGIIEGRKTFQNTMKYIKMGFSSNFGNMFSMMGASAFLPFLPMLPSQILLNNFLYDMSQTTLSTDSTDEEDTIHPLRWDTHYFGRYITVFGLVSSIFDFITFYVLYKFYTLYESFGATGFQTGWFIESIATQVLIIYIIRTKRVPFFKSWPSVPVICSTIGIVVLAWIIPFTFVGKILLFKPLSPLMLSVVAGIVAVYLVIGEIAKAIFYRVYKKAL